MWTAVMQTWAVVENFQAPGTERVRFGGQGVAGPIVLTLRALLLLPYFVDGEGGLYFVDKHRPNMKPVKLTPDRVF
jgi:hypothetical protein